MIGSIIGDIIGSKYEFQYIKTKDFPLFSKYCDFTDDSILTVATADWLLHGGEVAKYYSNYAADNDCPMGGAITLTVASLNATTEYFSPRYMPTDFVLIFIRHFVSINAHFFL